MIQRPKTALVPGMQSIALLGHQAILSFTSTSHSDSDNAIEGTSEVLQSTAPPQPLPYNIRGTSHFPRSIDIDDASESPTSSPPMSPQPTIDGGDSNRSDQTSLFTGATSMLRSLTLEPLAAAKTTSRGILIDYDYSSFISSSGDDTIGHRTVGHL